MATTTKITSDPRQRVFGFVIPAGADGELLRKTILVYLTAAFLLVVFLLFVLPQFGQVVIVQQRVREAEEKIANLTQTLEAVDRFSGQVDPSRRTTVFMAIPGNFDPGYILLSLRDLARKNQVGLTSYSLGGGKIAEGAVSKEESGNLVPHPVKVEISGSPLNLINFIDNLYRHLPVAEISSLSVSEVTRLITTGSQESKLSVELVYYHLPSSVQAGESLAGKFLTQTDFATIDRLASYDRVDLNVTTPGATQVNTVPKQNLFE